MSLRTLLGNITRTAGFTTALGGLLAAPAQAAAPQVHTQAPGFYRMQLGEFEITALCDGVAALPVDKLLTNIPPARVNALLAAAYLTPPVDTSINAFLVNTGSKLFLVDTGAGEVFGPGAGHLVAQMKAAGYQPEQVDDILLTHAHPDHVAGLTLGGKAVFPNARVHADKREVDYWMDAANMEKAPEAQKSYFQMAKAGLTPYAEDKRLEPFTGNTELAPGIKTIAAPGHTPGHTFYAVESGGQKIVFWGDMMHVAAVQFPEPSATVQFDSDSKSAAAQRAKAYAEAAKQGYAVAIAHVSFPGIGRLHANGKGYTWVPVNYSIPPQAAAPAPAPAPAQPAAPAPAPKH